MPPGIVTPTGRGRSPAVTNALLDTAHPGRPPSQPGLHVLVTDSMRSVSPGEGCVSWQVDAMLCVEGAAGPPREVMSKHGVLLGLDCRS